MQSCLQQALNLVANNGNIPGSKVHGANMGPTWVQQNPCWPHGSCYLGWHLGRGCIGSHHINYKNMLTYRAITSYLTVDHVEYYVAHYRMVDHVSSGLFVFFLQFSKQIKSKIVQMIVPCIQCHVCSHTQIITHIYWNSQLSQRLFQFIWHFTITNLQLKVIHDK